jgi:hypothetical protein
MSPPTRVLRNKLITKNTTPGRFIEEQIVITGDVVDHDGAGDAFEFDAAGGVGADDVFDFLMGGTRDQDMAAQCE